MSEFILKETVSIAWISYSMFSAWV